MKLVVAPDDTGIREISARQPMPIDWPQADARHADQKNQVADTRGDMPFRAAAVQ